MPNITIYVPQYICDRLNAENNKSGLVSKLLAGHYASTAPGVYMPTVEKEEKRKRDERLKKFESLRDNGIVMRASDLDTKYTKPEETA